jgi:hypothetical protein
MKARIMGFVKTELIHRRAWEALGASWSRFCIGYVAELGSGFTGYRERVSGAGYDQAMASRPR